MKLKVFTLRLDPDAGGFDDSALTEFLADKEALTVSEHFFVHEQVPTWALLVSYREVRTPGAPRRDKAPPVDWRAELPEEARPLYDALRKWRKARADSEGRPSYVFLTNRNIADIARTRPATKAALMELDGVGQAKADSFGEELLALVASLPPAVKDPPAGDTPAAVEQTSG